MRKHHGIVLIALLGALALSAVGAASASAALPEFQEVGKKNIPVTGTGGSGPIFSTTAPFEEPYSYRIGRFTGEVPATAGSKTIENAVLSFEELLGTGIGVGCPVKTVVMPDTAKIGYINKAEKTVGVRFEPATEPITNCESPANPKETMYGGIVAKITPVNVATREFTLTFNIASRGIAEPLWLEGEKEEGKKTPLAFGIWNGCKIFAEKELCSFGGSQLGIAGKVFFTLSGEHKAILIEA